MTSWMGEPPEWEYWAGVRQLALGLGAAVDYLRASPENPGVDRLAECCWRLTDLIEELSLPLVEFPPGDQLPNPNHHAFERVLRELRAVRTSVVLEVAYPMFVGTWEEPEILFQSSGEDSPFDPRAFVRIVDRLLTATKISAEPLLHVDGSEFIDGLASELREVDLSGELKGADAISAQQYADVIASFLEKLAGLFDWDDEMEIWRGT